MSSPTRLTSVRRRLRLLTRQLAAAKARLPYPQSLIQIRSTPLHTPSTPTYARVKLSLIPLCLFYKGSPD